MFDFFALLTNKYYWKLHSLFIKAILRIYGINVGKNFYCEGIPKIKLRGKATNISIGNNVKFLGDVDLRIRENGKIILADNVTIEGDVRLVSAREGVIMVDEKSIICAYTIINGGADVRIGKQCIIAPRCSINANEHIFRRDTPVQEAGFVHESVIIENDCWVAANVTIMKGVTLSRGSIIGAGAVVTKNTVPYSINGGLPARKIGERA